MAARRLVSSLSRPAKSIILHPSPNPKYTQVMGLGFPSTKTRHLSTKPDPDRSPHWAAEYRRRLGVDDARVIMQHPCDFWQFPKDGEVKISFNAMFLESGNDVQPGEIGTILAIARNTSGDVLGLTAGPVKCEYGNKLELQLYALRASANLAEDLKMTGMHVGPVVYEESQFLLVNLMRESMPPDMLGLKCNGDKRKLKRRALIASIKLGQEINSICKGQEQVTVARCFDADCEGSPREEFLSGIMPPDEDLEEVGRSCPVYCGAKDKLKEILSPEFFYKLCYVEKMYKALVGL